MDGMPRPSPYAAKCPTRLVLDRVADKWTVLVMAIR
jgi:DNA-binding HxlR family transcriptional regulator